MSIVIESIEPGGYGKLGKRVALLQKRVAGRMEQGIYSKFKGYGLRRDLQQPLEKPKAGIPLSIRPLQPSDLDILLPPDSNLPAAEKQQINWRRHFYRKMPTGCFVAVDLRSGTPCYMQWLIGARDNNHLAKFKCFPKLANDEALLEQTYIIPSHRGLGIMPAASAEIAERAADFGARYVLAFGPETGVKSFKALKSAGFSIELLHRRTQIGYGTIVWNTFRKMAENDPRRALPC